MGEIPTPSVMDVSLEEMIAREEERAVQLDKRLQQVRLDRFSQYYGTPSRASQRHPTRSNPSVNLPPHLPATCPSGHSNLHLRGVPTLHEACTTASVRTDRLVRHGCAVFMFIYYF